MTPPREGIRRVRSLGGVGPNTKQDAVSEEATTIIPDNNNTIMDEGVGDPGFAVRYPSLLANKDLRRSKTVGSLNAKAKDNATSQVAQSAKPFRSWTDLRPASPDSEMTRFPTLSQFEAQTSNYPQQSGKDENLAPISLEKKVTDNDLQTKLPGSWPPQPPLLHTTESSGEFFYRMTGLDPKSSENTRTEATGQLSRSKTMTASNPAARLPGPFDPLNSSIHFNRQEGGLRRSATDRIANGRYSKSNRRPYSEHFYGDGGVAWDSFLQHYEKTPGRFPTDEDVEAADVNSLSGRARRRARMRQTVDSDITPTTRPALKVDTTARPKSKNERCVEHLKQLGFGGKEDGGLERLALYAEVAGGNLEEAIEMIEEERTAYKQRGGS